MASDFLEACGQSTAMSFFTVYYVATSALYLQTESPPQSVLTTGAAILVCTCFLIYVAIYSVPFCETKLFGINLQGVKYYTLTPATVATFFSLFGAILFEISGFGLVDRFLLNAFPLALGLLVVGFALPLFVHVRSYYIQKSRLNPAISGKGPIQAFYLGREVRPKLGLVDLKILANRVILMACVLSYVALLYKVVSPWIEGLSPLPVTLVIFMGMHLVYFLDGILTEHIFMQSKEAQVGFGYASGVSYFLYPFAMLAIPQQIRLEGVEFSRLRLSLNVIFFVFGMCIYRLSNCQKYSFTKRPIDKGVKTIPTRFKGKKLLCSGWWGVVRHPNYLGDLLVQLAMSGFLLGLPSMVCYMDVLFLIHRAYEDNKQCKEKYGDDWDKYCAKVKYLLLPGMY